MEAILAGEPAVVTPEPVEPVEETLPVPHWQRETGLSDPDAVVRWLAEGDSRINGGNPLPWNTTDLLRADREGRHADVLEQ